MSAFVVDKVHIDALVDAAMSRSGRSWPLSWYWAKAPMQRFDLDYSNADAVGSMLWAENVRSVQRRYPDTIDSGEYPGPADFATVEILTYRFECLAPHLSPVEALKALACYEYQSCEHDGWADSQARAFCDALRHDLINRLPGYAEAQWSVSR